MSLNTIMSYPVVTVEMDDPLSVVKEIFDSTHFHHLIVVASGCVVGVISDRNLLKEISPRLGSPAETEKDRAVLNKRAHQIMTRPAITLPVTAQIHQAVSLFNQRNISCIPVVDDNNKPVGIVSWRDILKAIENNRNKKQQQ